jgi:hypothetical protein
MTVSMAAAQSNRSAADWSFRAEGVTKVYGGTLRANDAITLSVQPGEVYGLLGPNCWPPTRRCRSTTWPR